MRFQCERWAVLDAVKDLMAVRGANGHPNSKCQTVDITDDSGAAEVLAPPTLAAADPHPDCAEEPSTAPPVATMWPTSSDHIHRPDASPVRAIESCLATTLTFCTTRRRGRKVKLHKKGNVFAVRMSVVSQDATHDHNARKAVAARSVTGKPSRRARPGSDAMEGSDVEGSEEARTATPAHDPGEPTKAGYDRHMLSHMPYRAWCPWCITGRGLASQHRQER